MVVMMTMAMAVVMVPVPMNQDRRVIMVPSVLAGGDDCHHAAEGRDGGGCRSGIIVAVGVSTIGLGSKGGGGQCNRGRSSNSDCAAGHNTHVRSFLVVIPSLGSNADVSKQLRRNSDASNYVFAM
jgi:hypothetical protein